MEKETAEKREYLSKLVIISDLKGFAEEFKEVYDQMGFEIKLEELPLTNKIYQKGKAEGKTEYIKKILRKRFPDINITELQFIDELAGQQNLEKLDQTLISAIEAKDIQEFKEKVNIWSSFWKETKIIPSFLNLQ